MPLSSDVRFSIRAALIGALCLLAGLAMKPASAATMTFTGIPDDCAIGASTWDEAGITATGTNMGQFNDTNAVHMDDGGTSCGARIAFTTGGTFDAISMDVRPL